MIDSDFEKGFVMLDDSLLKEFVFGYFKKYFIMYFGKGCSELAVGF